MNTGIQDAWNLGWKLALVALGKAREDLLDTYEVERWPVGRNLLRYTDRAFSIFTRVMAGGRIAAWIRRTFVARILPRVFRSTWVRGRAFRFVSELAIAYRDSPAAVEARPRLRSGPRAGARLPDARVEHDGRETYLQKEVSGPRFHLLVCGDPQAGDRRAIDELKTRYAGLLEVRHLTGAPAQHALMDTDGQALPRLGVRTGDDRLYLIRPDGYIGARCSGRDLQVVSRYLARWLVA